MKLLLVPQVVWLETVVVASWMALHFVFFEVIVTSQAYVEHHLIKISLFSLNSAHWCLARPTFIGVGMCWLHNDNFANWNSLIGFRAAKNLRFQGNKCNELSYRFICLLAWIKKEVVQIEIGTFLVSLNWVNGGLIPPRLALCLVFIASFIKNMLMFRRLAVTDA